MGTTERLASGHVHGSICSRASGLLVLAIPYEKIESAVFVCFDNSFELGYIHSGMGHGCIAIVPDDEVKEWLDGRL